MSVFARVTSGESENCTHFMHSPALYSYKRNFYGLFTLLAFFHLVDGMVQIHVSGRKWEF